MVEHILQSDQRDGQRGGLPDGWIDNGSLGDPSSSEKITTSSSMENSYHERQAYLDLENASKSNSTPSVGANSERVLSSGKDVACFVVDLRDDGDESLTFRSFFLGTVFAGFGAALSQVLLHFFK